jgi:sec-independent protein translocase protein TatB
MFDIAFSEIVVVAVVALIVIGPERLPKVARTLGHMFGRLQRYVNDVKADINREIQLDELRKLHSEVQSAAQELQTSVTQAAQEVAHDVEGGLRSAESQLQETVKEATGTAPAAETGAQSEAAVTTPTPPSASPSAGSTTIAPEGEAPRQPALPGFERI